jgi:hypothetical protein
MSDRPRPHATQIEAKIEALEPSVIKQMRAVLLGAKKQTLTNKVIQLRP